MSVAKPNAVRFTPDFANLPYARLRMHGKASRRPVRPLRPPMVWSGEWNPANCDYRSCASPICFQTAFGKAPSPFDASMGPNRGVELHRGWQAAGAGITLRKMQDLHSNARFAVGQAFGGGEASGGTPGRIAVCRFRRPSKWRLRSHEDVGTIRAINPGVAENPRG